MIEGHVLVTVILVNIHKRKEKKAVHLYHMIHIQFTNLFIH